MSSPPVRRWLTVLGLSAALALTGSTGAWPSEARATDGRTIPTPEDVLGRSLGERLTPGDVILDVLDALDRASDRVTLLDYGRTVEDRPLRLAVLGRPDRLETLDAVLDARRTADPDQPIVLWLAFGVHGDEASSSEAALALVHRLALEATRAPTDLFDRLLLVVDPNANPDGRARHVEFLRSCLGAAPDPDPEALEHAPPWPSGRTNHYLFDLNRDWAWATQVETQRRIEVLRRFDPEVYVDFHEMGSDRTYFFPPAADPVHPAVPEAALDWLEVFGRANAEAFDRRGWLYFVRDVYDLYYPAYGDTYPILRGGVGMTYEMAGGRRSGLAIDLPSGRSLTLADRVERHLEAALTTVRTAARQAPALRRDALARRAMPAGATWLWRADRPEAGALAALLARHGVEVERLTDEARLTVRRAGLGRPLESATTARRIFPPGSYTVTARGATRPLVEALLEQSLPDAAFVDRQSRRLDRGLDAEIYDVTAWALPLAFDVEVWRLDAGQPGVDDPSTVRPATDGDLPRRAIGPPSPADPAPSIRGETPELVEARPALGWLLPPGGVDGYRLAASLLADGFELRWAAEPLDQAPAGTLFVASGEPEIARRARRALTEPIPVDTAWSDDGVSLGGRDLVPLRPVRVGLLGGRGVSPTSHGALWHLLDRVVGLAPSRRSIDRLSRAALDDLDVLLLPHGEGYGKRLGTTETAVLRAWIERGGVLVAIRGAAAWARDAKLLELEKREADDDLPIHGVAVATVRGEHPLIARPGHRAASGNASSGEGGAGPAVLVLDALVFEPTGDPQRDLLVARTGEPVIAGATWPAVDEHLAGGLLASRSELGDGEVVAFTFEPAFRGMWRATMPLLLDAILVLPSL